MQKKDIIKEIFEFENVHLNIKRCALITEDLLLDVISRDTYNLNKDLNIAPATVSKYLKILFPDRISNNARLDNWLLEKYLYKYCRCCSEVKYPEDFSKNSGKEDGLNSHCKLCKKENEREYQKEYQRRRKLIQIDRMPKWANIEKIRTIYRECPKGHHVDHVVPLQGKLVSGLHVEYNLQYLLAEDNLSKGNKFEIL